MKKKITTLLVLLALCFSINADAEALKAKSMKRAEDPVIVKGSALKALEGKPISTLGVFALKSGKLEPIPFQVDELDPQGSYVFTSGKNKSTDSDNGKLDNNDELVFMVMDAGDQVPKSDWPADISAGMEITINDPSGSGVAWAYIFSSDKPLPKSKTDYVTFKFQGDRGIIDAKNYTIGGPDSVSFFDELHLIDKSGKKGPDIVDRLKIRASGKTKVGLKVNLNLDDLVKAKTVAWIDGPVRVIRRGKGYLDLGPLKIKGKGFADSTYYFNHFNSPTTMDIPFNASSLLKNLDLYGATDFNMKVIGQWSTHGNLCPKGTKIDGKMDEYEKSIPNDKDEGWHVTTGQIGTFFHRLILPKEWSFATRGFHYVDDITIEDPPEDHMGTIKVGYNLLGFINLKKGHYVFWQHFYFPKNFKWGEQQAILNILDKPLKVLTGPGVG